MKIINIHHPDTFALAIKAIHQRPIIMQLPSVFVLLAAPTSRGAEQLNETKQRLSGKNYGTAIGSLSKFIAQAIPESLPEGFNSGDDLKKMTGTFIRLRFRDQNFQSATLRDGTHQGLLLDGVYAELFKAIEHSFASCQPDKIWDYNNYSAPLCTSCNISGHPEGSIIDLDKALSFAETKGISFFIKGIQSPAELGSYPIFGYEKQQVSVYREGPNLNAFKEKVPPYLRSWEAAEKILSI